MNIQNNQSTFETSDFYLSASLYSAGLPLINLDRSNPRTVIFVFDNSGFKSEHLISQYWNRTLVVPAKDLVSAITELKTRLHTGT